MPVLADAGRTVAEATIIVEYLDLHHPGPVRLIPGDAEAALEVRLPDRIFDNYVMTPMQRIVLDVIRAPEQRSPADVADAHALLDRAYAWLDGVLADRERGAGATFSLADCAAAPSLFYADWAHPIDERHAALRAYRRQLLARPSFARAADEARRPLALLVPGHRPKRPLLTHRQFPGAAARRTPPLPRRATCAELP